MAGPPKTTDKSPLSNEVIGYWREERGNNPFSERELKDLEELSQDLKQPGRGDSKANIPFDRRIQAAFVVDRAVSKAQKFQDKPETDTLQALILGRSASKAEIRQALLPYVVQFGEKYIDRAAERIARASQLAYSVQPTDDLPNRLSRSHSSPRNIQEVSNVTAAEPLFPPLPPRDPAAETEKRFLPLIERLAGLEQALSTLAASEAASPHLQPLLTEIKRAKEKPILLLTSRVLSGLVEYGANNLSEATAAPRAAKNDVEAIGLILDQVFQVIELHQGRSGQSIDLSMSSGGEDGPEAGLTDTPVLELTEIATPADELAVELNRRIHVLRAQPLLEKYGRALMKAQGQIASYEQSRDAADLGAARSLIDAVEGALSIAAAGTPEGPKPTFPADGAVVEVIIEEVGLAEILEDLKAQLRVIRADLAAGGLNNLFDIIDSLDRVDWEIRRASAGGGLEATKKAQQLLEEIRGVIKAQRASSRDPDANTPVIEWEELITPDDEFSLALTRRIQALGGLSLPAHHGAVLTQAKAHITSYNQSRNAHELEEAATLIAAVEGAIKIASIPRSQLSTDLPPALVDPQPTPPAPEVLPEAELPAVRAEPGPDILKYQKLLMLIGANFFKVFIERYKPLLRMYMAQNSEHSKHSNDALFRFIYEKTSGRHDLVRLGLEYFGSLKSFIQATAGKPADGTERDYSKIQLAEEDIDEQKWQGLIGQFRKESQASVAHLLVGQDAPLKGQIYFEQYYSGEEELEPSVSRILDANPHLKTDWIMPVPGASNVEQQNLWSQMVKALKQKTGALEYEGIWQDAPWQAENNDLPADQKEHLADKLYRLPADSEKFVQLAQSVNGTSVLVVIDADDTGAIPRSVELELLRAGAQRVEVIAARRRMPDLDTVALVADLDPAGAEEAIPLIPLQHAPDENLASAILDFDPTPEGEPVALTRPRTAKTISAETISAELMLYDDTVLRALNSVYAFPEQADAQGVSHQDLQNIVKVLGLDMEYTAKYAGDLRVGKLHIEESLRYWAGREEEIRQLELPSIEAVAISVLKLLSAVLEIEPLTPKDVEPYVKEWIINSISTPQLVKLLLANEAGPLVAWITSELAERPEVAYSESNATDDFGDAQTELGIRGASQSDDESLRIFFNLLPSKKKGGPVAFLAPISDFHDPHQAKLIYATLNNPSVAGETVARKLEFFSDRSAPVRTAASSALRYASARRRSGRKLPRVARCARARTAQADRTRARRVGSRRASLSRAMRGIRTR